VRRTDANRSVRRRHRISASLDFPRPRWRPPTIGGHSRPVERSAGHKNRCRQCTRCWSGSATNPSKSRSLRVKAFSRSGDLLCASFAFRRCAVTTAIVAIGQRYR
jgi:hypothetical protein